MIIIDVNNANVHEQHNARITKVAKVDRVERLCDQGQCSKKSAQYQPAKKSRRVEATHARTLVVREGLGLSSEGKVDRGKVGESGESFTEHRGTKGTPITMKAQTEDERRRLLGEDAQWCELHLGRADKIHPFSRGHTLAPNSATLICTECLRILKKAEVAQPRTSGRFQYWQLVPRMPTASCVKWGLGADSASSSSPSSPSDAETYEVVLSHKAAIILRAHGYELQCLGPALPESEPAHEDEAEVFACLDALRSEGPIATLHPGEVRLTGERSTRDAVEVDEVAKLLRRSY